MEGPGKYCGPEESECYVGSWRANQKHGSGRMRYSDGAAYDGEWENDKPHGRGTFINPFGVMFRGEWEYGRFKGSQTDWQDARGVRTCVVEGVTFSAVDPGSTIHEESIDSRTVIPAPPRGKTDPTRSGYLYHTSFGTEYYPITARNKFMDTDTGRLITVDSESRLYQHDTEDVSVVDHNEYTQHYEERIVDNSVEDMATPKPALVGTGGPYIPGVREFVTPAQPIRTVQSASPPATHCISTIQENQTVMMPGTQTTIVTETTKTEYPTQNVWESHYSRQIAPGPALATQEVHSPRQNATTIGTPMTVDNATTTQHYQYNPAGPQSQHAYTQSEVPLGTAGIPKQEAYTHSSGITINPHQQHETYTHSSGTTVIPHHQHETSYTHANTIMPRPYQHESYTRTSTAMPRPQQLEVYTQSSTARPRSPQHESYTHSSTVIPQTQQATYTYSSGGAVIPQEQQEETYTHSSSVFPQQQETYTYSSTALPRRHEIYTQSSVPLGTAAVTQQTSTDSGAPLETVVTSQQQEQQEQVIEEITLCRNIPRPVEYSIVTEFVLPRIRPTVRSIPVPVYAPRVIEVPVLMEDLSEEGLQLCQAIERDVDNFYRRAVHGVDGCTLENFADGVVQRLQLGDQIPGSHSRPLQHKVFRDPPAPFKKGEPTPPQSKEDR
eukprot:Protomagalhaensia_sp_Gyna_25__4777@NODE_47_length_6334_cov_112_558697_g35_i0_p1_GENE_NODE_47_length_6334_cov_112_558697_g35_i0NODE_47_length_6334_cov_112_558697_g35_i0_p1_ORF_typecomplete_len775_score86_46MORN/PF02493_20/0_00016MORN/PF02493_20/0_0024MORN/PF02493_20/0_034MORN/PF02493_20/6_8e07MORN/PF02493_20/0_0045MORN/PF02493_20/1_5e05MORN/PF02493_20/5_5e05MORN/PF02493_20/1_4e03MORN/PF02493_20/4_3e03_NODE_47_length_6334_cov_112_558697_g35_i03282325